ncbi:MAG: hypothetical protein ACLFUW_03295 [Bacteroidales bacterium]
MEQQKNNKVIYFHVGLGKTASTYLQYKVFPKFKGIYYIQRTRYGNYPSIIEQTNYDKYLISREFDRQFEREVRKMAAHYPDANIIIVLRRNDSWLASQYRRYVKNGGYKSFGEFVDIENNQGHWDRKEGFFSQKLKLIEELFPNKPLVLFHEELKKDPFSFIDRIAKYTGTEYEKNKININPQHKSYSEKQLKVIKRISKKIFPRERKEIQNKTLHYISFRSRWLLCHLILYSAALIPSKWVPEETIIDQGELEKIKNFYKDDWSKCIEFAKEKSFDPSVVEILNS